VTIYFQITNSTTYLPLRSEQLSIKSARLRQDGLEEDLVINSFELNSSTTDVKVVPVEPFDIGTNYTLKIEYSGVINKGSSEFVDWPEGLYYDNYTDPNGNYK
jgi:hypothetical protein